MSKNANVNTVLDSVDCVCIPLISVVEVEIGAVWWGWYFGGEGNKVVLSFGLDWLGHVWRVGDSEFNLKHKNIKQGQWTN